VRGVLDGKPGPQRAIVLVNAAAALWVAGAAPDLPSALPLATASVDSGAARKALEKLVRASRAAGEGA
jgi:anthranilate phosphoribosyltransferase